MPRTRKKTLAQTLDLQAVEAYRATLPTYRRKEYYSFLSATWDIVLASYLVQKTPHTQGMLPVQEAAKAYGFPYYAQETPPEARQLLHPIAFYVDIEHVMDECIDLARPLILAQVKGGTIILDGMNRLYKAAQLGEVQLPAYMLTQEEEQACRR